jgi:predicted ABC-type ATPase
MANPPSIVVLGGPNGAGKTTVSRAVLGKVLGLAEFVNADIIAQGLSGFDPERAAFAAGRIMLARLRELAAERADFAFETTLASRTFAPWLADLRRTGYRVHLVFVFLRTPELAVRRVRSRIRQGGHSVPPEVIRRRYQRGIANFLGLYLPLADAWHVYDNSTPDGARIIASSLAGAPPTVDDPATWERLHDIARSLSSEDDH